MALKNIANNLTLEVLLDQEARCYSELLDEQNWYVQVAQSFNLPPKGCPQSRYLIARDLAFSIWKLWNENEPHFKQIDQDVSAVLQAGIIFTIANFLISTELENYGLTKRNKNEKSDFDYFLRLPSKREEVLERTKEQLEAIACLLKNDELPTALSGELRSFHTRIKERQRRAEARSVLIFRRGGFIEKAFGERTRIHDVLLDFLIFDLVEIILRSTITNDKTFRLYQAQKIVLTFINRLIDPTNPVSKGFLSEDSLNERRKQIQRNHNSLDEFQAILDEVSKKLFPSDG